MSGTLAARVPRQLRLARIVSLLSSLLVSIACDALVSPPEPRVDRTSVTAELGQYLDEHGHFQLPAPTLGADEISAEQARNLAEVVVRRYLRPIRGTLEREHGGRIEFSELHPCNRIYYAYSPYVPLDDDQPGFGRRHVGPQWLLTFCRSDGLAQLSVAIAALATNVSVKNERLEWIGDAGSEFVVSGIPRGESFPPSPEVAVTRVSELVGKRVAQIPMLELAGVPYSPQFARWKLGLESGARVTAGTPPRETTELALYVAAHDPSDHRAAVFRGVAASTADKAESLRVPVAQADPESRRTVVLTRRPGVARHFELVTGASRAAP